MIFETSINAKYLNSVLQDLSYHSCIDYLQSYNMMGWFNYCDHLSYDSLIERLHKIPLENIDYIVSLGTGGSYQGLEAIVHFFNAQNWIFLGPSLDLQEIQKIKSQIQGKRICFNIISKNFSTLEIKLLIDIFQQEIKHSIVLNIITSQIQYFDIFQKKYPNTKCCFFEIEHNTGGRFSILSEMGMLAFYLCGLDIKEVQEYLKQEKKQFKNDFKNYTGVVRGASRFFYHQQQGYFLEALSTNKRSCQSLLKWTRQLFAESNGKNGLGIYISLLYYPEDAHSFGQILSDGPKKAFETFLILENDSQQKLSDNLYSTMLSRDLDEVNHIFLEAVIADRIKKQIPVTVYKLKRKNLRDFLSYILTDIIAISIECCLLKINPFDQPGVDGYKEDLKKKLHFNVNKYL